MSNETKQDDTTFEEYAATKPHLYGNHIEDVRGRSMADAAVGPCDCDPHIEHCPSCAPYLHEPLTPAGEEDKATCTYTRKDNHEMRKMWL